MGAIALGLGLYFFVVVALAAAVPHYYETVNRVTMEGWFTQSLSGATATDQAVLLGLSLLFLSTQLRSIEYRAVAAAIFVAVLSSQQAFHADQLFYASIVCAAISLVIAATRGSLSHGPSNHKPKLTRSVFLNLVAASFLSLAISVEAASLVERVIVSDPIQPGPGVENAASLESGVWNSFAVASPAILAVAAFSFLYRGYIITAAGKLIRPRISPDAQTETIHQPLQPAPAYRSSKSKDSGYPGLDWAILAAALAVSILIAAYPHLPSVNPANSGVSTDERAYLGWMDAMENAKQSGLSAVIQYAFNASGGDRPLSLLLLYASGLLAGGYHISVRYAPLALAPALVVAAFLLARYGLKPRLPTISARRQAVIIAMFAALSPQVVAGVYAGFLANWIALIPATLCVLFLARTWDTEDASKAKKYAAAFFGLLVATMLCHVYVWGHLIIVSSIFLALSAWAARSASHLRLKVIVLAIAISASVAVDIAKSELIGVPSGISRDTGVAGYSFNLENFDSRWSTLSDTLSGYVGGYLLIPVLLALTLFWVFRTRMSANSVERVILAMLFALAIPILFGSMTVQARLIYNTPFFIPAAVVLFGLTKARLTALLAFTFVILVLANYAVGAMSNLHLVVPDNASMENPFLVP